MPKNPFSPTDDNPNRIKRNVYDLSHQRLTTTDFGKCLPILCQEVIPGDSFKLGSSVGIRAMPTAFPVQTRCRVSVSYFYVRNRCLHDEFEDFIYKTKDNITLPWLKLNNARAKTMISTNSLGDALGVPSTVGNSDSVSSNIRFGSWHQSLEVRNSGSYAPTTQELCNSLNAPSSYGFAFSVNPVNVLTQYDNLALYLGSFSEFLNLPLSSNLSLSFDVDSTVTTSQSTLLSSSGFSHFLGIMDSNKRNYNFIPFPLRFSDNHVLSNSIPDSFVQLSKDFVERTGGFYLFLGHNIYITSSGHLAKSFILAGTNPSQYILLSPIPITSTFVSVNYSTPQYYTTTLDMLKDATDDAVISSNPFVGDNPTIPLNALPFRAYEMIMNYFYRNDLNNPYVLNGEVQYNKFIPSTASGADTNVYDFHYHNWELDKFTSALQSPQFGAAPLVGLTYNALSGTAEFTFVSDGGSEYKAQLGIDDDGNIANISNFSQDIPSGNLQRMMDLVNYGISINDLRNVNSFQRFLENSVRKGLRYRNQLKSHAGVNVDYPDIDVPQYIGGYSGYLQSGQNTNLAASPDAGLGDFNGSLGGSLSSSNDIYCYCPEHGFIIGIMSIYPIPLYSQSIPKFLIKRDAFDFFQQEFSKIGKVPMHYAEVTPLQNRGQGQSPDDVFGYQKAWYDYMSELDSAHGDFRTTLQQFTLSRTFEQRPTLVNDFVRVHPDQLNQIFVTNNIADRYGSNAKFLCNIYHKITAKRQIPRNGVPSLE